MKVIRLIVCLFLTSLATIGFGQSRYGPNDTLTVPYIVYEGDTMTYAQLEMVFIFAKMSAKQRENYRRWTRLRNAVYVTYPYAKKAGAIINEVNLKLKDKINTNLKSAYAEPDIEVNTEEEFEDLFAPFANAEIAPSSTKKKMRFKTVFCEK